MCERTLLATACAIQCVSSVYFKGQSRAPPGKLREVSTGVQPHLSVGLTSVRQKGGLPVCHGLAEYMLITVVPMAMLYSLSRAKQHTRSPGPRNMWMPPGFGLRNMCTPRPPSPCGRLLLSVDRTQVNEARLRARILEPCIQSLLGRQ